MKIVFTLAMWEEQIISSGLLIKIHNLFLQELEQIC